MARAQEVRDAMDVYLQDRENEHQRKQNREQRRQDKQQQQAADGAEVAAEAASMAEYLEQQSPRYDAKDEEDAFYAHPPGTARYHLPHPLPVARACGRVWPKAPCTRGCEETARVSHLNTKY